MMAGHRGVMSVNLRSKLSLVAAQVKTAVGRPGGFFIQYDYAGDVQPVEAAYPELEALCARAPIPEFIKEMGSHIPAFRRFGEHALDPEWGHGMFSPLDGAAAYTAVKKFRPNRIIEIGSGDSTRYLAKAGCADILCIDPAPRRAIEDLPVRFARRIIANSDADLCAQLKADDILFVDSSHIMLPGMDVDIIFNRCFPRLASGVIVHVHDIFLPFDYPPHWKHRNWNEQSALAGWLFGGFEIVYPGHYAARTHSQLIDRTFEDFPPCQKKNAGSIWLRKC
jgi:hypothetical protein